MNNTQSWSALEDLSRSLSVEDSSPPDAHAFSKLNIRAMIDDARLETLCFSVEGLHADFSKHLVSDEILEQLVKLADESDILGHAGRMMRGEKINVTEDRAVMHMALRGAPTGDTKFSKAASQAQQQMGGFSDAIRSGDWCGSTGKAITDVINIGIGGSDLGPRMVCEALREFADGPNTHFISNVDGAEILSLVKTLNAETTLIVISSKTFTTAETMMNARTAIAWLRASLTIDAIESSPHCMAITASPEKAAAFGIAAERILTFDESIGGRYSLWSTLGFSISVSNGQASFESLLEGAAAMDQHFTSTPPARNMPILMALLGIWYNNFMGAQSQAVIPYCERLGLFVDYLQQMDMESNGKSATVDNAFVNYQTGPVIWGQTGTNGQHAFFQLLHQGQKLIPVDFIGTVHDGLSNPEHHRTLNANMIAQSEALMCGQENDDPHRHYPGNRPSTVLLLDELTPFNLGLLIALYEHKVFAQGVIWRINSFDQWGVELGKALANGILDGQSDHDASTLALIKRSGLDS